MEQIKKLFFICLLLLLNGSAQTQIFKFVENQQETKSELTPNNSEQAQIFNFVEEDETKDELIQQATQAFFELLKTSGNDLFNYYDKSTWLKQSYDKDIGDDKSKWVNQEKPNPNDTKHSLNPLIKARVATLIYGTNYKFFLQKLENDESGKKLEAAFKNLIKNWEAAEIGSFFKKIQSTQKIISLVIKTEHLKVDPETKLFFTKQACAIFKILVEIFDDAKIII